MTRILQLIALVAFDLISLARAESCQALVFRGLSSDCNLGTGESADETTCCAALARANEQRCFCDSSLMQTIEMVIGEQGVAFFRQFSRDSCDAELTLGAACAAAEQPPASDAPSAPPQTSPTTVHEYNRHRQSGGTDDDLYSRDVRPSTSASREAVPLFPPRAPPEAQTIARFVLDPRRDSEIGFTADALVLTGVRNRLDDNTSSLTFFAPTNEAWYSTLFALGVTKEELFGADAWLEAALRYHTVHGSAPTAAVGFGTRLPTDLDAEDLLVETSDEGRAPAVVRVQGCAVLPIRSRRDIAVGTSMVHYLDCVMFPPNRALPAKRTIAEYIRTSPSLSMFANSMFSNAGRGSIFERISDDGWFTVFAPSDDAFTKFLRDPRIGMSFYIDDAREADLRGAPSLTELLTYHVIPGFHTKREMLTYRASKSLVTMDVDDTNDSAPRRVYIDVRGPRSTVYVNGCAVVGAEAFARNGVVHVIDCVMSPNFNR